MVGGPGEGMGPGEKGPWPRELSKEFSLLCTLGDFEPNVGGFQNDSGRFRIRRGTCKCFCGAGFKMSKRASSSEAESSRTWRIGFWLLCSPTGSSWPVADAILI